MVGWAAEVRAGAARPDLSQRPMLPVPVNRHPQLAPDALADLSGDLASGSEGATSERHDRDHVGGSDPRVDAGVETHVDSLHRRADRAQQAVN